MAGTTIPNEMHSSELAERCQEVSQGLTQMHTIIALQTTPLHLAAVHGQDSQEVDRIVAHIVELLSFDLSGAHRQAAVSNPMIKPVPNREGHAELALKEIEAALKDDPNTFRHSTTSKFNGI